jgi:hypothetical protein
MSRARRQGLENRGDLLHGHHGMLRIARQKVPRLPWRYLNRVADQLRPEVL